MSMRSLQAADPDARLTALPHVLGPEEIRRRAMILPPVDRELIVQLSTGRRTLRQLARAMQVHPGTLCRRVARLRRRLDDPVLLALQLRGHTLSQEYYRIGLAYFAEGRPVAAIAREFALSSHATSAILAWLRGWSRLESARRASADERAGGSVRPC